MYQYQRILQSTVWKEYFIQDVGMLWCEHIGYWALSVV